MKLNGFFKKLFSFFSSLKLAIFLILSLAFILTVATFYESYYGTAAAHTSIYKTRWFGLFLFLIGISVTCAAFKKYPWKRHQVGFLVTHLGIVILIIGSFMTYWWGIDGTLVLLNGEERETIFLDKKIVSVEMPQKNILVSSPLEVGPYLRTREIVSFPVDEMILTVDRFLPYAKREETIVESDISPFEAVQLELSNQRVHIEPWLFMNDEGYQEMGVGPAQLVFKRLKDEIEIRSFLKTKEQHQRSLGDIRLTLNQQQWNIALTLGDLKKTIFVKESPFQIKKIEYFSDAIVENSILKNRSREPKNPAIQLLLVGPKGAERHVAFPYFPDFPSTHQKTSLYGAKIEFIPSHHSNKNTNRLELGVTKDKILYYRVSSGNGVWSGNLKLGKAYETGWMDLKFVIKTFYPHATKRVQFLPVTVRDPNNPKVPPAIRVKLAKGENIPAYEWVEFYETKEVIYNDEVYRLSFQPRVMPLYFGIYLDQFKMGTDPGTGDPASYESHVLLKDSSAGLTRKEVISMNEPLTYKNYTFYQSSYQTDDQGKPIGSVFSVGYDPGRGIKYSGSLLIVLGIFLMFFYRKTYIRILTEYKRAKESQITFSRQPQKEKYAI